LPADQGVRGTGAGAGPPADQGVRGTETFRPGRVLHALVGGLLELALASVCLGLAIEAGQRSQGAQTSLAAAAALWLGLGLRDLVRAGLRARVLAAELDGDGVRVRGATGARAWRWDELSAVEVGRGRTTLVTRDGRAHRVHAVRGRAQGERFKARVLARAGAATGISPGTTPGQRGPGGPDRLQPDSARRTPDAPLMEAHPGDPDP
jgi:hypothetical protein